jgi:hypothetical protein
MKKRIFNISFFPERREAATLERLRKSRQGVIDAVSEYKHDSRVKNDSRPLICETAKSAIEAVRMQAVSRLGQMRGQKTRAERELRRFQVECGVMRPVRTPDRLNTLLIAQAGLLAEGGLTGTLFIADGHMDVIPGILTGLAMAGINIVAGMATGFFCARYIGYRLDSLTSKPRDAHIRRFAWFGLAVSSLLLFLLHFGAARVRVTGDHSGIFDFSHVGFFQTFNDYYALALMTLGAATTAIAIFKGRNGICDPVPGYTEISESAGKAVDQAAEESYRDALQAVEEIYAKAADEFEEARETAENKADGRQACLALNARIAAHNNAVAAAIDAHRRMQANMLAGKEFIEQRKFPSSDVRAAELRALCIAEPEARNENVQDSGEQNQPRLPEIECRKAQADIRGAYTAYLAHVPEFTFDNHQEEKDHETA